MKCPARFEKGREQFGNALSGGNAHTWLPMWS
jgi:hypothetical protein